MQVRNKQLCMRKGTKCRAQVRNKQLGRREAAKNNMQVREKQLQIRQAADRLSGIDIPGGAADTSADCRPS